MPLDRLATLVFPTCTVVLAQMYLFMLLSDFRFDRQSVRRAAAAVCFFILAAFHAVSLLWFNGERTIPCTFCTLVVPGAVFEWIVSRYRGARFIFTSCISALSVSIVDFCAYLTSRMLADGVVWFSIAMRVVNVILWCIAMYLMVGKQYRRALNVVEKSWNVLILVVFSMYALLILLAVYPDSITGRPEDMPVAMVSGVVLLLMVVVLLQMIYNSMDATERRQKETILRGQLELSRTQHDLLSAQYDEIRRLRHDMKYHMNVLNGYVQSGNYDKLALYLRDYQATQAVINEPLPVFTKNAAVNTLAAYYDRRAKAAGISAEWSIALPEAPAIDEVSLTAVLGNALQNALEGCENLADSRKPFIRCAAFVKKNKLVLRVENTAEKPRENDAGRILSRKPQHTGIGLASIESVTELNRGHCRYYYHDGVFTVEIILPLGES